MKCEDCGDELSLQGRDRSGPDYICWTCTRRILKEGAVKAKAKGQTWNIREMPHWKAAAVILWPWAIVGLLIGSLAGWVFTPEPWYQALGNIAGVFLLMYATSYGVLKAVLAWERRQG